ncbi:hypothetical protein JB92DRAFT_3093902 [Gautieria morchelliformis]|nr:hypothetical protein JB92DRAFT_3093902 [Gautieria morchelliformis]
MADSAASTVQRERVVVVAVVDKSDGSPGFLLTWATTATIVGICRRCTGRTDISYCLLYPRSLHTFVDFTCAARSELWPTAAVFGTTCKSGDVTHRDVVAAKRGDDQGGRGGASLINRDGPGAGAGNEEADGHGDAEWDGGWRTDGSQQRQCGAAGGDAAACAELEAGRGVAAGEGQVGGGM